MSERKRQRVVIVGAGFGGLAAARALRSSALDVVLVDRSNYHTFLPLLYQVAAAELEPEEIAYPVRSVLRKIPFASFVMREVMGLTPAWEAVSRRADFPKAKQRQTA